MSIEKLINLLMKPLRIPYISLRKELALLLVLLYLKVMYLHKIFSKLNEFRLSKLVLNSLQNFLNLTKGPLYVLVVLIEQPDCKIVLVLLSKISNLRI